MALIVVVPLVFTRRRRVHEGVLATSYALFVVYVATETLRLR